LRNLSKKAVKQNGRHTVAAKVRLNSIIGALENGRPAFLTFAEPEIGAARALRSSRYDGLVFEMEHNGYDVRALRDCLQYLLDRKQILTRGNLSPGVTPLVRVPPNGSEMNQWVAKQALDTGVYGLIFPHVSTVEEAANAVASCRYPRPSSRDHYHPSGLRGDGPKWAAPYWGMTELEYYEKADVWPLNPNGELFVTIMCEELRAVKNLPSILKQVPGIGAVLIGEGDLSQDMGYPRQYDHPEVLARLQEILNICKEHDVVCGHPHVTADNVEGLIAQGYRLLMAAPQPSFLALERGLSVLEKSKHDA
jgi:4-hydroxy-2-oxoheptanedioate aldolase